MELARVEAAAVVDTAIAEGVRAPERRDATALDRAARRLGAGRQLLVLDNCEHVLVAARSAAEQLLSHCPGLVILATSREPLGADGERAWSLPPMAVPPSHMTDEHEVLATEAAKLFCDRAQLAAPGGGLRAGRAADVADICRRLEGLPLALELAAAWVPVLSLRQVLERLDDALAMHAPGRDHLGRHRTMRAAVDWSHQLLTEPQRMAFARFSVFTGGFMLESAEAVLDDAALEGSSTLEMIATLVARSLVTSDTSGDVARYRLLEPVRQYAADQLRSRPGDERDALSRMLRYLAALAEAAEGSILGGPDVPWLRRLDAELANIRSALAWGFENGDDTAARLATALPLYCFQRALFAEGLQWARLALPTTGHLRARALLMTGWLAGELGDAAVATEALRESNRLMTEGGWHADLVLVLWVQGLADYIRGDLDAMEATGEEAVALASEVGSPAHMMRALWVPATCANARGDLRRSLDLYGQAHAIAKQLDNYGWAQLLLSNCASTALAMEDTANGRRMLTEALQTAGRGDEMVDANLVEAAGALAVQEGQAIRGLR
ncbi:MAG TPA: hypothetical protein VH661_06130, partial [Candidatus Dormibacteraeota bacterium]|nr:hypothetical protein [Candidatus Dormibacteraeota bacterium]